MKSRRWNWKTADLPAALLERLGLEFESSVIEAGLGNLLARLQGWAQAAHSEAAPAASRLRTPGGSAAPKSVGLVEGDPTGEVAPDQLDLLVTLGDVYSRLGLLDRSLAVDHVLVRLRPGNSTFHYNLACSYSRMSRLDEAMAALRRALELGYHNFDHLRSDSDLENLKRDHRFQGLLEELDERLGSP